MANDSDKEQAFILENTRNLLGKYKDKIIQGIITDAELKDLSNLDNFKKKGGYVAAKPNKDNYSQLDALKNFVQVLGHELKDEQLHALNTRLLSLEPDPLTYQEFWRNNSFAKVMFAYEGNRNKDEQEKFYDEQKPQLFTDNLKSAQDLSNFKQVIIEPLETWFKLPTTEQFDTQLSGNTESTTQQEKSNQKISKYYRYAIFGDHKEGRRHKFEIKLPDDYKGSLLESDEKRLKGDSLKTKILEKFHDKLNEATTREQLTNIEMKLKDTPEYKILKEGQDTFTRLFRLDTSSVKAFHKMVKDVKADLTEREKEEKQPHP